MSGVCDPIAPEYDPDLCAQQRSGKGGGAVAAAPVSGGTTSTADGPFGGIGSSTSAHRFSIPGNLVDVIQQLADDSGIDAKVLAAVIYQKTRWRKKDLTEANLSKITSSLSDAYQRITTPSQRAQQMAGGRRIPSPVGQEQALLRAGSQVAGISLDDMQNLLTKDVGTSGDIALGGAAAKQPLIPGLSDDAAYAVQRVADSDFIQYLGRLPTNEEYINMSKSGWTEDTLRTWLRAQPHPAGGTIGQYDDAKSTATKYAQQWLGREPDPGELAYLIAQKYTSADQIDAYYNQLKQRSDTGDPAFAWVGDPTQWRNTQSQIESLWKKAGLTTTVDPHLVNQAVAGGWSIDQVQQTIDNMPAPGYAQGVTVGNVNRTKPIAQSYKDAISSIHQGEPLTPSEIAMFISMNPASIRDYYRSLPARGRQQPGASPAPVSPAAAAAAPAAAAGSGGLTDLTKSRVGDPASSAPPWTAGMTGGKPLAQRTGIGTSTFDKGTVLGVGEGGVPISLSDAAVRGFKP